MKKQLYFAVPLLRKGCKTKAVCRVSEEIQITIQIARLIKIVAQ
jgi:hypothetical protein